MSIKRMAGVTLIELIVAMVIVGAALAGLVAVYNRANIASADPLLTQQMLAIGETMMEEILQKPFTVDAAPAPNRQFFNDVKDYDNYGPAPVTTVNGDAIDGLSHYRVAVKVDLVTIGGASQAAAQRVRVTVSTTHTADTIVLTGWKVSP